MADDRTAQQIQDDRDRLESSCLDAVAVAASVQNNPRVGVPQGLTLPALISGVVTSKSIGGLLRKLFGVSNRDLPAIIQTQTYPVVTTAAAGAVDQDLTTISQDADFYAMRMSITSGNDGTGAFDSLLQFVFGANDRRWVQSQSGTHILGVQGTGQRPYVFPQPIYLARNTVMRVVFTARTANARTYFLDLHGRKTVDVSSLDLTTRRF